MANRKRNVQMKFYVTEEEKRLIEKKMRLLPTQRYGAYLRKMAILMAYLPTTFHAYEWTDESGVKTHIAGME